MPAIGPTRHPTAFELRDYADSALQIYFATIDNARDHLWWDAVWRERMSRFREAEAAELMGKPAAKTRGQEE